MLKKVATWWQYNWAFVSRVLRIAITLVVVAVVVEEHREPMSTLEVQEEVLDLVEVAAVEVVVGRTAYWALYLHFLSVHTRPRRMKVVILKAA